jgi:hypothetical protein
MPLENKGRQNTLNNTDWNVGCYCNSKFPKTYTWSGTFILKDGRYTFTFSLNVLATICYDSDKEVTELSKANNTWCMQSLGRCSCNTVTSGSCIGRTAAWASAVSPRETDLPGLNLPTYLHQLSAILFLLLFLIDGTKNYTGISSAFTTNSTDMNVTVSPFLSVRVSACNNMRHANRKYEPYFK